MPNYVDHSGIREGESYRYFLKCEIQDYLSKRIELEKYNESRRQPYGPLIGAGFSAIIVSCIAVSVALEIPQGVDSVILKIVVYLLIAILCASGYIGMYALYSKYIKQRVMKGLHKLDPDIGKSVPLSLDVFLDEQERSVPHLVDRFNHEVVAQISSALSMIELFRSKDTSVNAKSFYLSEAFRATQHAASDLLELVTMHTFISDANVKEVNIQRAKELCPLMFDILDAIKDQWDSTSDIRLADVEQVHHNINSISGELNEQSLEPIS